MARSFEEIQTEMLAYKARDPELKKLDSTSKTAVWRRILMVVASSFQTLEQKWDALRAECDTLAKDAKPMTLYWYQQKALRFQYGCHYDPWGQYDNADKTPEQIAATRIVKYASAYCIGRKLYLKVATTRDDELVPLGEAQQQALKAYFRDNASAGTLLEVVSRPPDAFKLQVTLYYDPLVLDESGNRLDGTAKAPVPQAVKAYLKNLGFNGELKRTDLSNAMEEVPGIQQLRIRGIWSKYGLYSYEDRQHPNVGPIDEFRCMDAGYAELDEPNSLFEYRCK